jgi:hypothetical protein
VASTDAQGNRQSGWAVGGLASWSYFLADDPSVEPVEHLRANLPAQWAAMPYNQATLEVSSVEFNRLSRAMRLAKAQSDQPKARADREARLFAQAAEAVDKEWNGTAHLGPRMLRALLAEQVLRIASQQSEDVSGEAVRRIVNEGWLWAAERAGA